MPSAECRVRACVRVGARLVALRDSQTPPSTPSTPNSAANLESRDMLVAGTASTQGTGTKVRPPRPPRPRRSCTRCRRLGVQPPAATESKRLFLIFCFLDLFNFFKSESRYASHLMILEIDAYQV